MTVVIKVQGLILLSKGTEHNLRAGKITNKESSITNDIRFRSSLFDRQDSLRSDYMSDRESRYGIVQQASIESTDSRLCYLTSSEVSQFFQFFS